MTYGRSGADPEATGARRRYALPREAVTLASLICVNGLNYGYFLLFARKLAPVDFVHFTTSTAITMFAFAIAEAGAVYAAPPFLRAYSGKRAARIAGGFLAIATCALCAGLAIATTIWVAAGREPISAIWLARCVLLVSPNLLMQNWLLVRLRQPFAVLLVVSTIRTAPVVALVLGSSSLFDLLLCGSWLATTAFYISNAVATRVVSLPRPGDLVLCLTLIREFFVVRVFSMIVTSSAPLLVGTFVSSGAAAIYLLGDRAKALVASLFQPCVQSLYLACCRNVGRQPSRAVKLATSGIVIVVVLVAVLCTKNADRLNAFLYASKHPDPQVLSLFVLAGCVSVVSSLLYFLFLIPRGHASAFVRSAIATAIVFVTLLIALSPRDGVKYPAIAVLTAEVFLLAAVGISVVYYRHPPGASSSELAAASAEGAHK